VPICLCSPNIILDKKGVENCNPTHTHPMEPRLKLNKSSRAEEGDSTKHRRIVGRLRYLLALHTRPDPSFPLDTLAGSWGNCHGLVYGNRLHAV
jgi:hypothetical protein